MKYNPKIYSQVHPADTKPTHVGWYPSCLDYDSEERDMRARFNGSVDMADEFWWYWDGKYWQAYDTRCGILPVQRRRWFGLRENAE